MGSASDCGIVCGPMLDIDLVHATNDVDATSPTSTMATPSSPRLGVHVGFRGRFSLASGVDVVRECSGTANGDSGPASTEIGLRTPLDRWTNPSARRWVSPAGRHNGGELSRHTPPREEDADATIPDVVESFASSPALPGALDGNIESASAVDVAGGPTSPNLRRNPLLRFQRARVRVLLAAGGGNDQATAATVGRMLPRPVGAQNGVQERHRLLARHRFVCHHAQQKLHSGAITRAAFVHIVRESGRSSGIEQPFAAQLFRVDDGDDDDDVPTVALSGGGTINTNPCSGETGSSLFEQRRPKRMRSPRAASSSCSPPGAADTAAIGTPTPISSSASTSAAVPSPVLVRPIAFVASSEMLLDDDDAQSPRTAEGKIRVNRLAQARVRRLWTAIE